MLLLIVGMPCSGKTTALDVCRSLGARILSSGDVVREEIARQGLPYNERTDRDVAGWFHEKGRERLLVERVLVKVGGDPQRQFIALDGLRSAVQLRHLQEMAGVKPVIVALEASPEERLKRCLSRHRFPHETKAYLLSRDETERERGLEGLIKLADYRFNTNGMDEKTFRKEFKVFMKGILSKESKG